MSSRHQLVRIGLHYGSGKAELGTMLTLLRNLSDNNRKLGLKQYRSSLTEINGPGGMI
jgi:hypothetical protein